MLAGAAGVAICATQVAPTRAGLRLELDVAERGAGAAAPERWIVWIDGTRLASQPAPRESSPAERHAIFRGSEDLMWLVDPARRSYFQLDPKSAEATAAQLAGLRNGVAQGLELLSPEQREGVKGLFGDLATAPPDALPPLRLRARGEPARHAGLECARQDVLEGERRVAELCLAAWGTGLLTRERAAALPALLSFLRRTLAPLLREVASLRPLAPLVSLGPLEGFPLAARAAGPGGSVREIAVVRVDEHAVDPARFELPAGYARSLVPPFE
jgi:hypothetical protein